MIAQTLKNDITAHQVLNRLGETAEGTAWCLKALHPSDPLTEVKGIPDECCQPTTFLNFQSVSTLSTTATSGTWSGAMQLLPNPVVFMAGSYVASANNTTIYFNHTNTQLVGERSYEKYANFSDDNVAWRLAYAGVTIVQDGPALADQGTIVACQKEVYPMVFTTSSSADSTGATGAAARVEAFPIHSKPSFDVTQAMPNAYMSQSKEGVYIPLKLTNDRSWFSARDGRMLSIEPFDAQSDLPSYMPLPQEPTVLGWPYFDCPCAYTMAGPPYLHGGVLNAALCSTNVADICFKNVSYQSSFTCFYRYGFEVQVLPNSPFSPFLALSPKLDLEAIHNYFRISRELKDAYPASYNDFGIMMSQLMQTIGSLSPVIGSVNPLMGMVARGVGAFGKAMSNSSKGARQPIQSRVSASQVESGRAQIRNSFPKKVRKQSPKSSNKPKQRSNLLFTPRK